MRSALLAKFRTAMSVAGFLLSTSDSTASLRSYRTWGRWNRDRGTKCSWGRPLLQGGLSGWPVYTEPQEVSGHLRQVPVPEQNRKLTSAVVLSWPAPRAPGDPGRFGPVHWEAGVRGGVSSLPAAVPLLGPFKRQKLFTFINKIC